MAQDGTLSPRTLCYTIVGDIVIAREQKVKIMATVRDSEKYLKTSEVLEILHVCRMTLRRLNRRGEIPALVITPKLHRYKKSDVMAYIERHLRKAVADDE